ncbi:delta 1-pyrroline-5-carboxylate reductase [Agyrium rufum]|nr:delta 1-pyrroline-5-carboxylate reductase [Agyrium rufum]
MGDTSHTSKSDGLTLTILGCGNLGSAILFGILASLEEVKNSSKGSSKAGADEGQAQQLSSFIACVHHQSSKEKLEKELSAYSTAVTVLANENLKGVQEADVVLLAVEPQLAALVLQAPGIADALDDKLLLSILAGQSQKGLEQVLYPNHDVRLPYRCQIVAVLPNTASLIRQSMTVIAQPEPPLPEKKMALVKWIFERIGRVTTLPAKSMNAATALCGSGPALCAVMLEALAEGAVGMGVSRKDAQLMAAQVMNGTAGLVLNGEHPALVREKVSTPGGCTVGGVAVLEEGGIRGTIARSVREATTIVGQMGRGVKDPNRTRF